MLQPKDQCLLHYTQQSLPRSSSNIQTPHTRISFHIAECTCLVSICLPASSKLHELELGHAVDAQSPTQGSAPPTLPMPISSTKAAPPKRLLPSLLLSLHMT